MSHSAADLSPALGMEARERTTYLYNPLDANQVRLVALLPGTFNSTLTCNIITADIDALPSYEALSSSGNGEPTAELQVNDTNRLLIGHDLADALLRLRKSTGSPRLLWIDKLCINMENPEERGYQVDQMWELFATATQVVVWLGNEVEKGAAAAAFGLATLISEHCCFVKRVKITDLDYYEDLEELVRGILHPHLPPEGALTRYLAFAWTSLAVLYRQSWFTRIWSIAEATANRNVTMMYGASSCDWHVVALAATWFRFKNNPNFFPHSSFTPFRHAGVVNACDIRCRRHTSRAMSLRLVDRHRNFDSEDPRDKIFSQLGLSHFYNTGTSRDMYLWARPDYTKSVKDVFREFAVLSMDKSWSLEMLSHVQHAPGVVYRSSASSQSTERWPSWVPRWDLTTDTKLLAYWGAGSYHASAGAQFIEFHLDKDRLTLRGIQVDVVKRVYDVMGPNSFSEGHQEEQPPPFLDLLLESEIGSSASSVTAPSVTLTPDNSPAQSIIERFPVPPARPAKPANLSVPTPPPTASPSTPKSDPSPALDSVPFKSASLVVPGGSLQSSRASYHARTSSSSSVKVPHTSSPTPNQPTSTIPSPVPVPPSYPPTGESLLSALRWTLAAGMSSFTSASAADKAFVAYLTNVLASSRFTEKSKMSAEDKAKIQEILAASSQKSNTSTSENSKSDHGGSSSKGNGVHVGPFPATASSTFRADASWICRNRRPFVTGPSSHSNQSTHETPAFSSTSNTSHSDTRASNFNFIGIGPASTQPGDIIAVLFGGSTLFVLRPVRGPGGDRGGAAGSPARFRLIGECYVRGMMKGEVVMALGRDMRRGESRGRKDERGSGSGMVLRDFELY
ncbi:hypothetical protein K402DRAFT_461547 [Aulographum hederae CBS 113979]|uniref:Heterokaryon incompatibility domain-containing protein n=1 Tax=Aulographum hederae CBS 113979 TaxID=1176131 RepID=A0A6G1H7K9_9PEZI|nr:hypothetical protein K402DRAFT_461547 [Aulographum hederae CBS 113979]